MQIFLERKCKNKNSGHLGEGQISLTEKAKDIPKQCALSKILQADKTWININNLHLKVFSWCKFPYFVENNFELMYEMIIRKCVIQSDREAKFIKYE